jgi:hypothetical protein
MANTSFSFVAVVMLSIPLNDHDPVCEFRQLKWPSILQRKKRKKYLTGRHRNSSTRDLLIVISLIRRRNWKLSLKIGYFLIFIGLSQVKRDSLKRPYIGQFNDTLQYSMNMITCNTAWHCDTAVQTQLFNQLSSSKTWRSKTVNIKAHHSTQP